MLPNMQIRIAHRGRRTMRLIVGGVSVGIGIGIGLRAMICFATFAWTTRFIKAVSLKPFTIKPMEYQIYHAPELAGQVAYDLRFAFPVKNQKEALLWTFEHA